ncbi:MAG: IS66 family insertion sequence element accessory protein TnpB [Saprospiraceae bacterium]|nr:IS66 family insertion sequence element accessory protein TnpB [Candidatus Parvibacillus calidus]
MRKGFDGLCGLVHDKMDMNPMDGSVYLFINRQRNRMKMLVWEMGGFVLYYKRLEQGTLNCGQGTKKDTLTLDWELLVLMIQGIKTDKIIRKKRYKKYEKWRHCCIFKT